MKALGNLGKLHERLSSPGNKSIQTGFQWQITSSELMHTNNITWSEAVT